MNGFVLFWISLSQAKIPFAIAGSSSKLKWHEVTVKSSNAPAGCLNALTWVDKHDILWFFGNETFAVANETKSQQCEHNVWKFNPRFSEWSQIIMRDSTKIPRLGKGLSCFCGNMTFLLIQNNQHQVMSELWVYNVSITMWKKLQVPVNVENHQFCLAMWCQNNASFLHLLCVNNSHILEIWTFIMAFDVWKSEIVPIDFDFNQTLSSETILCSSKVFTWNSAKGEAIIYVLLYSKQNKSLLLLSMDHLSIDVIHLPEIKHQEMFCRNRIHWIDHNGNLHFIDSNSIFYSIYNMSEKRWSSFSFSKHEFSERNGSCFWHAIDSLWLYGGYKRDHNGHVVILRDLWVANISHPVIQLATPGFGQLPGDTLALSMVNKFIISVLVLVLVLSVSLRLCYKRELNQVLSRLKKNRVLYHQLRQESDKSTRL